MTRAPSTHAKGTGGTLPARPVAVPSDATWDARSQEWLVGHKDLTGGWHGLVTGYDAAGLVRSRQHFEAGIANGPLTRLHPSGAEAYRATFVAGKLHGDARALSSREPGAVPLRPCCVPPDAWALVTRYDHGNGVDQWFENEAGCPLLADGSLRPARPAVVPEAARYDDTRPGWELGESQNFQREGSWQRWSTDGEVHEVASYQRGKLHGTARTYQAGKLIREREYMSGVLEGPAVEHAAGRAVSGTSVFEDARIHAWQGAFSGGALTGRWTYWDDAGSRLFDRDYGAPLGRVELTHPVFAAMPPEGGWAAFGNTLSAAGAQGLALCAWIRASVGAPGGQGLREQLSAMTVALGSAESSRRLAELRKSRAGLLSSSPVQREEELGHWIQALLEGASPALVLGQLGVLLLDAPRAGLDFIEAAMALEPALPTFLKVRARLWFELGHPEKATQEALTLPLADPPYASWVKDLSRLLFPQFEFWPARTEYDLEPNPELPDRVSQPLAKIRSAMEKSALRLGQVRLALLRASADHARSLAKSEFVRPEPTWLPPDLSSLLQASPKLERYEFTEAFVGGDSGGSPGPDVVKVDETLQTSGLGISALMRMARVEWTCLCWLCWGAGLDHVALPDERFSEELRPPAEFQRALSAAFFQLFRVLDSRQTRGLRSKARGLPPAHWEGLNVDALEPLLIEMAFHEAREMRAVLYWLGDEECRSLWQDDLRDV